LIIFFFNYFFILFSISSPAETSRRESVASFPRKNASLIMYNPIKKARAGSAYSNPINFTTNKPTKTAIEV